MADDSLQRFGAWLRQIRDGKKLKASEAAAGISSVLHKRASKKHCGTTALSNFETGKVKPHPEVLSAIAAFYEVDVYGLLQLLFVSEHIDALPQSSAERGLLWGYLEAGVRLLSNAGEFKGFERELLRSLTAFAQDYQILDTRAQLAWEHALSSKTPTLECFWVASLDFMDNDDFFEVVRGNIEHGAKYVYFIRERYIAAKGRFDKFRARMQDSLGADIINDRLSAIPFAIREEAIIAVDFVVANPHQARRIGFQTIWKDDRFYNLNIPSPALEARIRALEVYVTQRPSNPVARNALYPQSPTVEF